MALAEIELSPHRNFKAFSDIDITEAFFNKDEHAELHTVDGKKCAMIIEEDALTEHSAHWEAGAKQSFDSGLYDAATVIYIKTADYGTKPKSGKRIVLDAGTSSERIYSVFSCTEESGVYRIAVSRQRQ